MGCPVDAPVFPDGPRHQGEVPQAADFRSGDHQGVVCAVRRDTNRHLAAAETAHEIEYGRQTVIVVQAHILFECRHAGFAVNQRVLRFLIVNLAAVLVDHRVEYGGIQGIDIRERNAHAQAVPLEGRQHGNQFLPGVGNFQPHFLQDIRAVEEHREVLRLGKSVDSGMFSVVVPERIDNARIECADHLVEIVKLGQVFNSIAHRIVHGEPAADAQHDIRAVSGNNRRQDSVGLHQFDVDFYTGLCGECIVDNGFQHGALVTACRDPDLQYVVVAVVLVPQGVVIHEEGADAAAHFVSEAFKEILRHRARLCVLSRDHDQVHIQLAFGHVLHRGSQRGDIVLEAGKAFRDPFVHGHELFQLDGEGQRARGAVALFAGRGDDIVHNLVQALAFQVHGFKRFRINLVQVVVTEAVGIRPGQHQQFAVDLVQAEKAVFHASQDRSHFTQRHFHPDGM